MVGTEISVTDDDSLPMVTTLTLTPASISESDDAGTTDVAENKTTVTASLEPCLKYGYHGDGVDGANITSVFGRLPYEFQHHPDH